MWVKMTCWLNISHCNWWWWIYLGFIFFIPWVLFILTTSGGLQTLLFPSPLQFLLYNIALQAFLVDLDLCTLLGLQHFWPWYTGVTCEHFWFLCNWYNFMLNIFQDDGLQDSNKIAAFDFDGCLAKTSVKRYISCFQGFNNWIFLLLQNLLVWPEIESNGELFSIYIHFNLSQHASLISRLII